MNKKKIKSCDDWIDNKILVIEEISFSDVKTLAKIDSNIRILKNKRDKMFGGIIVVFSGDLWQLPPVMNSKNSLYSAPSPKWSSINSAIFLQNSHRFSNDPEWGMILERLRTSSFTDQDMSKINDRLLSSSVQLNDGIHYCFACLQNKQRNEISNTLFKRFLETTHPQEHESPLPNHTILIMGDFYDMNDNLHSERTHCEIY